MYELTYVRTGTLEWRERPAPTLVEATDALVRPFVASRCDGDTVPLHKNVSRPMQAAIKIGMIDPVVSSIVGGVPFQGPFGIGHEAIAQVTEIGLLRVFRTGNWLIFLMLPVQAVDNYSAR